MSTRAMRLPEMRRKQERTHKMVVMALSELLGSMVCVLPLENGGHEIRVSSVLCPDSHDGRVYLPRVCFKKQIMEFPSAFDPQLRSGFLIEAGQDVPRRKIETLTGITDWKEVSFEKDLGERTGILVGQSMANALLKLCELYNVNIDKDFVGVWRKLLDSSSEFVRGIGAAAAKKLRNKEWDSTGLEAKTHKIFLQASRSTLVKAEDHADSEELTAGKEEEKQSPSAYPLQRFWQQPLSNLQKKVSACTVKEDQFTSPLPLSTAKLPEHVRQLYPHGAEATPIRPPATRPEMQRSFFSPSFDMLRSNWRTSPQRNRDAELKGNWRTTNRPS